MRSPQRGRHMMGRYEAGWRVVLMQLRGAEGLCGLRDGMSVTRSFSCLEMVEMGLVGMNEFRKAIRSACKCEMSVETFG
jgi:hypothetical protein